MASPPTDRPPHRGPQDQVLAEGAFEDAEHGTDGGEDPPARGRPALRPPRGSRHLGRPGPAHLDHRPAQRRRLGSYDDGRYVRLGELEANNGNQNYEIPAAADLDGLTSVVIWCDRFNVAFGTAPSAPG